MNDLIKTAKEQMNTFDKVSLKITKEMIELIEYQQAQIADLDSKLLQCRIELLREKANKNELSETIIRLRDALDELQENSEGVAGLHQNGDVATWESLRQGGQFESWLMVFDLHSDSN